MPNRLAAETSPYLLQHANNPVDWFPWGAEALDKATRENKPILLSIGYAACHWCHVMEHESFEDEPTAALMNERFVNIKVDREERPDLDAIYMQAVQAMTGHGGWPMTMFLTPDGVPFYGGTYFPKDDRHGMPSFKRVLAAVSDSYRNRPADIERTTASVREMYRASGERRTVKGETPLAPSLLNNAYHSLVAQYDERDGGFGDAPKFPQTMSMDFLLRYWARRGVEQALVMALNSFRKMARGGIYDQIGGGFARYSVDTTWLVPHFEKMLYDNALLIQLGAHLWQATRDDEVRRVTDETIAWAIREMRSPDGGFYSSYDADSEGHEGKFYVWSAEEFDAALGDDAPQMRAYWGVTDHGNFEGKNILSVQSNARPSADVVSRAKRALYDIRAKRVWPGRDDKILASWNGFMARGIAEAARAFDDARYATIARESAEFLFSTLVQDGRVWRSFKDGRARIAGYLEDHASLGLAAIAVYEITFDAQWLDRARALSDSIVRWFWDESARTFYDTASDHEQLITRPRDATDNAVPSGTSLAVELLLKLADLYDDGDARRRAAQVLESLAPGMARYPTAFGHMLGCADMFVNGATELAIAGQPNSDDFRALARAAGEEYVPSLVIAGGDSQRVALLRDRTMREGRATAYVCRNYTCDKPVTSPGELRVQLAGTHAASQP